jgi:heme A synthase
MTGRLEAHGTTGTWAPWWAYLLVIAPVNMVKQQFLPDGAQWWLVAVLTLVTVVAGVAVVTALYRASRRPGEQA